MLLKLEKIFFYAFLFLIPLQARMIISWNGNEWNSYFLYLADLLLVGVFILAVVNTKLIGLRFKKSDIFLALFVISAFFSVFASGDKGVSIFRWVKLAEFILLCVYIMYRKEFLGLGKIYKTIFFSGFLQSILAIVQFFKQSSLGMKFIEAGTYKAGAPGVATFISGDDKILRAYGSFPHPNVLAGFLLLAIFCFYALWLSGVSKRKIGYGLYVICYTLIVFALFLTFSRAILLVFIFTSIGFFLFRFFQLRTLYHTEERLSDGKRMMALILIFILASVLSGIIIRPYFKTRYLEVSIKEQAIDLRFFYNRMAISAIKERPLLGVGFGEFVEFSKKYQAYGRAAAKMLESFGEETEKIPEWIYQPAHNIFLLVASEIGILGALFFLLFVGLKTIRQFFPLKPKDVYTLIGPMPFLFVGFLVLGLADHYFLTLHSGGIMFWLGLALLESSKSKIQIIPNQIQNPNV